MKPLKTNNDPRREGSVLVQLRLTSTDGQPLNPYTAYDLLEKALRNHPDLKIYQAEFRIDKELKTSIE
jgi:hypothetical protein